MNAIVIKNHHMSSMVQQEALLQHNLRLKRTQYTVNHATWSAFQSGMQILQRYVGKSTADPISIAKANLHLLYQSLVADPAYRNALLEAKNSISTGGLPVIHRLIKNPGLQAELITIQKSTSITLTATADDITMYMPVIGYGHLDNVKKEGMENQKRWWKIFHPTNNKQILKTKEVILMTHGNQKSHILNTEEHLCVLLCVHVKIENNRVDAAYF